MDSYRADCCLLLSCWTLISPGRPCARIALVTVYGTLLAQTYGRPKRKRAEEEAEGAEDEDALLSGQLSAKILKEAAAQREEVDADDAGLGLAAGRQTVRDFAGRLGMMVPCARFRSNGQRGDAQMVRQCAQRLGQC